MSPQQPQHSATDTPGQPSWIAPVKPIVPDHELLVRIGGGSYGDVWLARSVVGTWRAVKVVFRDRFLDARPYEREFSGMQKFEPLSRSNEGFIDILQIGRNDGEGYFYYVMELADDAGQVKRSDQCSVISDEAGGPMPQATGQCLQAPGLDHDTYVPQTLSKALLQRGRLPIGECLELGITLNLALARLHSAGLIHRDIKPSNIIFVGGVPKLADIGLVIEVAEARSYVGTEGFIPPEGPNSPQADIYSLGKVLYEAGMGKDRKDFPEPLTQIAHVPDSAELLEFNAILLKACAANVKERYQSAEEMNADLALLQSGGSVRRKRTLTRRLRTVQRAGVMVTALALVIGAGWLWQARETHLVRELAAEKTKLADENRERLVRLDVANGVRLLDGGDLSGSRIWFEEAGGKRAGRYLPGTDLSGSLLWFADALPRVTQPVQAEIHRIRIQSVLGCTPRLLQVVAHEGSLRAGTFSPDGRHAATGSKDGELRVWDVDTAQPVFPPIQLGKAIRGLCFSRDGRRLIAHSTPDPGLPGHKEAAAFVLILDASTGRLIFQRAIDVVKTACSSDGRWLAVARTNFSIEVFDASTGRTVVELRGHSNEVTGLAFSGDGTRILTFSEDRTARVWRIPSGEPEGPPLREEKAVERAAISPDGRRVATGTEPDPGEVGCWVRTWDAKTGALIGSPIKAQGRVWTLFFDSAAGRRLFIGDEQFRLMVWDIDTQTEALPALKTRSYETSGRAFSPEDARLAVASQDTYAYVWSLSTGELLLPPLRHSTWVESVDFSPDGSKLLTTCDDGTARIWDLMTAAETEPVLKLGSPITDAAMSKDGSRLLVALEDGSIRRINLSALREEPPRMPALDSTTPRPAPFDHSVNQFYTALSRLEGGSPQAIAFDKSARQWAAALAPYSGNGNAHSVGLWRQEGEQLRHLELVHPRAAAIVAFDPDGSRLVTVADDVSIRVWNTTDGSLVRDLSLPDRAPSCAAVAPDARTAVVSLGRPDETARELQLLNLDTAQRIGVPIHEEEGIGGVAFSPDGRRLVVLGWQMARIWDAATGKPLTASFKPGGRLTSVGWSPDGGHVITVGLADMARIWDGATGRPELSPMWSADFRQAYFSQDGRFLEEWGADRHVRLWDAATGEVLTPRWHLDGDLWIVRITAGGQFVVASGDTIRLRTLRPNPLPADVIADYAQLLSGRRLNAAGVMEWIPPIQLTKLYRSLRAREPSLFAILPPP